MKIDEIERQLSTVIQLLETRIPEQDTRSARSFIDAGEPGVAFELLCSQLYEHDVSVSASVRATLETIGRSMGLEAHNWEDLAVQK